MNKSREGFPAYNFLKDPHLTYYLQSPYKIAQLLKSRRYKLQDDKLIQIDSQEEFTIDPYVLKRIDREEAQKILDCSEVLFDRAPLNQLGGSNAQEKFADFQKSRNRNIKSSLNNSKSGEKVSSSTICSKGTTSQSKQSAINNTIASIRGLKQFKRKKL